MNEAKSVVSSDVGQFLATLSRAGVAIGNEPLVRFELEMSPDPGEKLCQLAEQGRSQGVAFSLKGGAVDMDGVAMAFTHLCRRNAVSLLVTFMRNVRRG